MNNDENKEFLVRYSTSFKKDLKKISKQSEKVEKVTAAIKILREKGVDGIPAEMKPHYLKGKYKGCLECHIEGDLLIIWIQEDDEKVIYLMRLGSHSELCKMEGFTIDSSIFLPILSTSSKTPAGASLQLVPNSKFTIHNSPRTI